MENIRLRALTITDLPLTLKWHNKRDIIDMYASHPFPINEEMERKWYEKILTSNFPVTVFGIELIENNKLIGLTILRDINLINRSAETAIYIGDQNERSKGYSKEALTLTLNFAFNNLGLHRVFLSVREDNIAAIGLYEKMGFIREGILRDSIYKDGKYISLIIMSILEGEFYGRL